MAELLTVLVILAVLVSIAAPSITGMLASDRTNSAVSRIAGDIMMARVEAVRAGRRVDFQLSGGRYTVTRSGNGVVAADTLKRVSLTSEYPGVTFTPSYAVLSFDSRGLLSSNSAPTITAAKGSVTRSLSVSAVGNIYRDY